MSPFSYALLNFRAFYLVERKEPPRRKLWTSSRKAKSFVRWPQWSFISVFHSSWCFFGKIDQTPVKDFFCMKREMREKKKFDKDKNSNKLHGNCKRSRFDSEPLILTHNSGNFARKLKHHRLLENLVFY